MDRQRRSTSNSSEGVRWSLDSIELEQPSLRLITPGEENRDTEARVTSATTVSGPIPNDAGTESSGDNDDVANPKTKENARSMELQSPDHPQIYNRFILLQWWEEIISLTVAIICTALSVAVLGYMDGRSLNEWKLSLQPNTLIALLATITRAALVYPLAECLGHLKWRFLERPRVLAHLQTFDAASRGPLGAVKYLWTLPIHSPLATCAAILTTLLLLFQPFAQQTIEFASRVAPMSNETSYALKAISWNTTRMGRKSASLEPVRPALSQALYQALSAGAVDGSKNGHCSTSHCQFDHFDTLAVCSTCTARKFNGHLNDNFGRCIWKNESSEAKTGDSDSHFVFGIDGDPANSTTTKAILREIQNTKRDVEFRISLECWSMPGFIRRSDQTILSLWIVNGVRYGGYNTYATIFPHNQSSSQTVARIFHKAPQEIGFEFETGETVIDFGAGELISREDSKTNLLTSCRHDVGSSAGLGNLMNSTCLSFSTELSTWLNGTSFSDQFGFLDGTASNCVLRPCVQSLTGAKIQNSQFSVERFQSDTMYHYNGTGGDLSPGNRQVMYCSGDDGDCPYNWTAGSLHDLGYWIESIIDTKNFQSVYVSQESDEEGDQTLFYERLAAQLSAIFRSPANPDVVNITGVAYGTEIYVQVRWLWFILPLVLLASTLLIVVLSIWDSSRKNYLFKNNFLAAIAFELHGWEPHEYGVDGTWSRQSMRNVERKAGRMTARMQLPQDGDGGLRLKKE